MNETTWSLGVLIGLPLTLLLLLACLVLMILGAVWARRDSDGWQVTGFGVVVGAIVLVIAAWRFYPYSAEYHQWQPASGQVESIDSRLVSIGNDKSPSERFVVTLDDGEQYACDDTRCAQVKPGDLLDLSCKRAWQYAGTDGWDCKFYGREVAS